MENKKKAVDEEDEATLAAIDEGIADAKAGRTLPAEEVRKMCVGRDLAEALAKVSLSSAKQRPGGVI